MRPFVTRLTQSRRIAVRFLWPVRVRNWGVVMRKILSIGLAAGLAAGLPLSGHAQASADKPTTVVVEAQKRPKHGPHVRTWIRGESDHFIVYSDAPKADAQAVIARLERFHALLRHIAGLDGTPEAAAPRLELYYLAHSESLAEADPAGPDYAIGLYKSCEEGVQAYGTDMFYRPEAKTALEKQPENAGLTYIFEAYARHFLSVHDRHRTPLWFIDGFAHYVATARFDDTDALVGMAPEAYATYLQAITGSLDYNLEYADVLDDIDAKPGFDRTGAADIRNEFGARAWILTHWIESSARNRGQYAAYLEAVDGGAPPAETFERTFGLTPKRLGTTLWSYLKGRHLMAMKMPFAAPAPAEIGFQTLPPSADKLVLWRAALKGCATPAQGAKLLAEIRDEAPRYPESDLARDTLYRAEILWGDPRRALPWLVRAAADRPGDFDSQYLLGRAELALAQVASGDERAGAFTAARQAFVTAAGIDPNAPENIHAYFRAQILSYDQPNDAALSAAVLAWQLAPEVDSYALAAGLAYAHMGRMDDAVRVLHTVADDPHGRSLAGIARTWIARLAAGAPDGEIVAALKAGVIAPEGGRAQWTLANHQVLAAQAQAVNAESLRQMLNDSVDSGADPMPGQ